LKKRDWRERDEWRKWCLAKEESTEAKKLEKKIHPTFL